KDNSQQNIKNIAILGSTGSIGTQALEVIKANPKLFKVTVLTAQSNAQLLIQQALAFHPAVVVITNESKFKEVKEALAKTDIEVKGGQEALCEVVVRPELTIVLTALVGFAG